ncbi:fibrous sheath-interacting protein 1 isoform X2 [Pseudophryne corroboree]|uniref:fibrous sheath-interacting protein 1 isoform X2 n=1 Tax=Pseudophryne corroboree TaxID=495146 RepID=UPI0030812F30
MKQTRCDLWFCSSCHCAETWLQEMDIVKGSLDDISRPASVSRSRPGSRISGSFQADKPKINSTVRSLEVLTPESAVSQWDLNMDSDDEQLSSPEGEKTPQSVTEIRLERDKSMITGNMELTHSPEEPETDEEFQNELYDIPVTENNESDEKVRKDCTEDCTAERTQSTEGAIDPKLEKAIKRMKVLDEILHKKIEREKEVKAQSLEIRKQLWEGFQHVAQSSARSHEEDVNTITFLALTPQLDDGKENPDSKPKPERVVLAQPIQIQNMNGDPDPKPKHKSRKLSDSAVFEKTFHPLFPTQLPPEDCAADPDALQGNVSGSEISDLLNSSQISHQRTKQRNNKGSKKAVNFIQRNIELAKDAGSQVLLMDDEKLRLEQLLGDIQDGWSDDDVTADYSLCLVPGEGYTPEPGELEELAKIEAELQMFSSSKETIATSNCDPAVSSRDSIQDDFMDKFGNPETAPGEKVLRYARELREQKIRLKEIDQQLEDIVRSSATPSCVSRYSALLSESSVNMSQCQHTALEISFSKKPESSNTESGSESKVSFF